MLITFEGFPFQINQSAPAFLSDWPLHTTNQNELANFIKIYLSKMRQKKVGKYTLTEQLGKGQFGTVYKAYSIDKPGEYLAVKSLEKKAILGNSILERLFNTEVSVMQKIRQDNIMPLYDFLETGNNYYLVMKLCSEGDFEHFMKKKGVKFFEEEEAVNFLKQIMNGFKELHRNKIMHR